MTLEQVIEMLKEYYTEALKSEWIKKPLAWALFQTWRMVDAKK